MSKKAVLILLAVVVASVFVILSFKLKTTKATPVNVAEVKRTNVVEVVSASGRIQPQTKVDITAEVTGEIVKLNVREGQAVKIGDLLLVLDTVQLRADVDQARYALSEIQARLAGAKATLDQAEDEYHRLEKLYNQKLESERRFDDAKYAYENAKATYQALLAQVKQAEFRLAQRRDNLSKTKIVAPMDGVVTYLGCEEGEIAPAQTSFTAGKTLMTIANLDVFEVEVEVDETEINKIQLGQPAKIEIDAFPDTVFSGRVVEIGNTAILTGAGGQDQSTNFKVKVIFEEKGVRVRPGMSATVDITTSKHNEVLAVPFASIVMRRIEVDSLNSKKASDKKSSTLVAEAQAAEDSDKAVVTDTTKAEEEKKEVKGVFVVHDGKCNFVPVETGIADTKNIEVTSGLNEGDTVISGPYRVLRSIKDGDEVKVTATIKKAKTA